MSSPTYDADALIVGGGIVGLGLACALAGSGLSAVVVDARAADTRLDAGFDGRASAISAGSARILDGIGVWPALAAHAEPILEIRVSDGASPLHLHYDHADLGLGPLGYMVENRILRRALHERARALPRLVHLAPRRVETLTRDPLVRATLDDGSRIASRLLVGADGKASTVRAGAGIAVDRRRYGQTAIVCTVAHERPHRGIAQERFLPAGPFAILPLSDDRASLVWTERADTAPAMLALDDDDFLAEIRRRFTDYLGAVALTGPRWHYSLESVRARRLTDRRLALAGDAAHAIHPVAGQGLNLGIRDLAALAECAAESARLGLDIGGGRTLVRYQHWRRLDSLTMSLATDGLNRLFAGSSAPVAAVRRVGLAAVNRRPALKRILMRHAMGLWGDLPRLARGEPPPGS